MTSEVNNDNKEYGQIKIADDVVGVIAGLAATEIDGVVGMSGGLTGGISEIIGRKNLSKGVKVEVGDKEASIDLYIIVEYGVKIPEVAWKIQENVKNAVENMTGLNTIEVNIHIQGVNIQKEQKDEEGEDIHKLK
ncbi:Asp23/Gls24 family envelope stress response protein [Clostridiisalibacter paucivorans]|uniref:Asp23/Gls24 family envelope stress response protein n=1 Tax=Clostridiisalibacter paucivorans TaxID=408753 RepID=UPI00047C8716|nr:Asp23/Gls24 family envelope stress response protein [Clostridiisalibacter paucivorans]